MRRFAAGLRKDSRWRGGLTEPWSNGPLEGFVHKPKKLVRCQGYAFTKFATEPRPSTDCIARVGSSAQSNALEVVRRPAAPGGGQCFDS
jgi:hypothetical protein